jgi:hypothetical protein
MPRGVSWGTPGRSLRYLLPRGKWTLVGPALLLGGLLLGVLLVLYLVGYRRPLAPGAVVSGHAGFESRCEECHTPRRGVANLRCQRCHDPAGAGRLTNAAHVLFGTGEPAKAAAAPDLACARCHVEHRGRAARLDRIDEVNCRSCHFRSFGVHPEFTALQRESVETPGLQFPHERHLREYAKKSVSEKDACLRCHEPSGRDLQPVTFERHCASCHAIGGTLGSLDPIAASLVLSPSQVLARGGSRNFRLDEFEESRGRITKTVLRHKDDWVLANIRKLRRDVDPEGFAAERGVLQAREVQLQRRLALAAPLAALDEKALAAREAALDLEVKGLEGRLAGQDGALEPGASARLDEVKAAVSAAGDASARGEADHLVAEIQALPDAASGALSGGEYETRRRELLALLDAVRVADPVLEARAEDLRRRLLALSPGEAGRDVLTRALDQRRGEQSRVRDEIALRASGIAPPATALLATEERAIRDALADTEGRLADLDLPPSPALPPDADPQGALEVLTQACLKCHVRDGASLARVRAARPVLVHARFAHAPHLLQADCARCHAGVEKSQDSSDLNLRGVESCRECHRPRQVRADCQSCHLYHAPALP